jgi:predicted Fe-S protein YdhL (DUF1289 family)
MNLQINLELNMEKPSTPCVNLCKLDAVSRLCVGCGRSKAEIAGWKNMSEPERRAIMRVLAARAVPSVQRVAD